MSRFYSLLLFLLFAGVCWSDEIDFDRDIAPLLSRRCLSCHDGDDAEAKLDLSQRDRAFAGGENGQALHAGDLAGSLLWQRVAAGEMPEDKPLPVQERKLLQAWIEQGARWGTDPIDRFRFSSDSRAGYDWWSLQPLEEARLPAADDAGWSGNPIDRFVWAKLHANGLSPSPRASNRQLVRRVYFDLTGLPPSPDALKASAAATSLEDGAGYERLVDRLLASPHFGQRWARHWMDVVRFGESHGFEYNQPRNNFWWYRNWIIDALNQDVPYDDFVRQQIAGDALSPNEPAGWAATGFLVAGPHNTTKPNSDKMRKTMRHDELEDIVGTIGQTFIGLTVNCARCHDHKFDPITQQEYYQMVASVVGLDHGERELPDPKAKAAKQKLATVRVELRAAREHLKLLEADEHCNSESGARQQSEAFPDSQGVSEARERVDRLKQREQDLNKIRGPMMYTAISQPAPPVTRLRRGDVTLPAEPVLPQGLRSLNGSLSDFGLSADSSDTERRLQLANWITGNQNPTLARVIVNRLWHYHFGQGLVRTPSDFGFNGDRPSHPQLLDYLASELLRHNWNLKPIHRLILTSSTYQQSSLIRPEPMDLDADNRWLWRMSPRRMTAEEIRDSMLSLTDKLDDRHGGPGYRDVREYKYRGSHYYDPVEPKGLDAVRRTVYRFSPRGGKRTILDTFDCPDPSAKAPKRAVTTTPLQALSLLNNRFVMQMADAFAERAQATTANSGEAVSHVYEQAYGRPANAAELEHATQFVAEQSLAAFCRVVFNSNEFLYVR